MIVIFRK